MVKVTMAHLYLFQLTILLVVSTSLVVDSQFFFNQPIRPLYFLHKNNNNPNSRPSQSQLNHYQSEHFSPNPNQRSQEPLTSSEEEQNEGDNGSGSREEAGPNHYRRGALNSTSNLPAGFDDSIRANRPPLEPRPVSPLYGDPAIMDDEEEQVRSRYLWPFSTSVTVSKNKRPSPHHSQHLSGFQPPHLLPPHLLAQHHHRHRPPHRRDKYADLEYDKTRLKYEIYKLKAKKTISILQNKVELKKILSLILQQKIRALEWFTWYHDYVEQMYNTAQGGGSLHDTAGGGEGWGDEQYGLTDEEILHSKGSKTKLKKKTAKSSASSSQGLKRRRKKLQKDDDDDDETESDSDKEKLDEATSTARPTQVSRWSSFFGGGLLKRLRTSLRFGSTTTSTTTTTTTTKAPKKKESKKPDKQSQSQQSAKPHPSRSPQHRIRKQKLRPNPKPKETFNSESQEASSSSSGHKHHLKTSQDEEEDEEEEIDDTDTDETYNKNNDNGNPGDNGEAQDEDVDEGNLTYPDADADNDDTVVDVENEEEDLEDAESEAVLLATEAEDVVDENEDVVDVNRSGENEEAPAEEDEEDTKQVKDDDTASPKVHDEAGREDIEDVSKYRDEKVAPSSVVGVGDQDENGKDAIIVPTPTMTPGASNSLRKKLKKGEKKKNLKNSIYSILFKTMDAIDKKFSDDDEEDLDPDL